MGRHSRRGPVPKGGAEGSSEVPPQGPGRGSQGSSEGTSHGSSQGSSTGDPGGSRVRAPHPGHDGPAAHGAPGFPGFPDAMPGRGVPQVRGGHPEQREAGGGWGELRERQAGTGQPVIPRQRPNPEGGPRQGPRPGPRQGPRQDYLAAFEEDDDVFARAGMPHASTRTREGSPPAAAARTVSRGPHPTVSVGLDVADGAASTAVPAPAKAAKGRTFTGIAAAAVTTVLAVVVAGQVADGRDDTVRPQAAVDRAGAAGDTARGDGRPAPSASTGAIALTYAQKMAVRYPLGAQFKGSGRFDAVPGVDKAPGKGRKYTYRVDVEQGLGLDGALFAEAVQQTLNDDRSWAHGGARTFERIHSGRPDFVITLASPGTTAVWCAKSGLDTAEDNVSCDSAATERVMINAYRWAQGSKTFGDEMYAYRQMLINHEVGHRLGFGHVTCDKDGELAPVMQQQTKFLDHDGIHCLPNPWAFPGS
ncbi:DUF3152 domain-containing protein [Streptomyces rishiriensis]|uniref:DUF3152 domain-containing protein n=1 Tax=Streptomyces rishiriensis TaxID=68264 RepID=UPI0035A257B0